MGAPDSYKIPGTYSDGYGALGDAVAVPVVRFLAQHLLWPLAQGLGDVISPRQCFCRQGIYPLLPRRVPSIGF